MIYIKQVPRKGGPGITQSDLLVINKTDLAEAVGADLKVMDRDAKLMRGAGPTVFAQVYINLKITSIDTIKLLLYLIYLSNTCIYSFLIIGET